MARVRGPLLSMTARGQIAKSMVFSSWRGIAYTRQLVTPANPRTSDQTQTRTVFSYLNDVFRAFGPGAQIPWNLFTLGRPMIPRNGFIKINLSPLREAVSIEGLLVSPGARGGPSLTSFVPVTGAAPGEIDWELVPGTLPSGWEIASAYAVAIRGGDPHNPFIGPIVEQEVATPGPYEGTLTGLLEGENYLVSGFVTYTKPDLTLACSLSIGEIVASGA